MDDNHNSRSIKQLPANMISWDLLSSMEEEEQAAASHHNHHQHNNHNQYQHRGVLHHPLPIFPLHHAHPLLIHNQLQQIPFSPSSSSAAAWPVPNLFPHPLHLPSPSILPSTHVSLPLPPLPNPSQSFNISQQHHLHGKNEPQEQQPAAHSTIINNKLGSSSGEEAHDHQDHQRQDQESNLQKDDHDQLEATAAEEEGGGGEEEDEEEELEELGAMKEMMYKIAAMQPVDIDPATIRKPKRRNVRISDDPQSVAARHRRERISEKIRILQRLVPGGTKMDTASMLEEAVRYVKFLKREIRNLQQNNPSSSSTAGITAAVHGGGGLDNINWQQSSHHHHHVQHLLGVQVPSNPAAAGTSMPTRSSTTTTTSAASSILEGRSFGTNIIEASAAGSTGGDVVLPLISNFFNQG